MSSRHLDNGNSTNDFPFLDKIAEIHRNKVLKIINLKMSVDDKLERLEDYMTVSQLKECRRWMENRASDFVPLLTDSDQEFVEEYVVNKDVRVLDAVLRNYDNDTVAVYEIWKRNSGLVPDTPSTEEEKTPTPVKEKKISKKTKKVETESEDDSEEKSDESTEEEEEEKPRKKKEKEQKIKKDKKEKAKNKKKKESDEESEDEKETKKKTKKGKKEDKKDKKIKKEKKVKKAPEPEIPPVLTNADLGTANHGFKIPTEFFSTMRPVTNILILGSTGVGKSTFINGLVNYLTFESMEEAKQKGFHVLIKTGFSHTDEQMRSMRVEVEPTIEVERYGHGHDENEDLTEGQSATQAPKSYVFRVGPEGQERMIRIIDTPGVGDVRGTMQDQRNFTGILNFIADFEEIHAILLLLEPNKARLDLTFRYCINELLTHLHATAARNILFCFTKARQTFYRPGESYNCLRTHLDKLYQNTKIEVPLDNTNMFTFDNESFRFLCAWSKGAEFASKDVENFSESWNKAVEQNYKMLQRIQKMQPHHVTDTLSVNNIRRLISTLARPLAELARNQLVNVRLIEEKLAEIQDCMNTGKDLQGKLYMETVQIDTEELDQPITVCTHKDCVEYKQLNEGGVVETIYAQECHVPCYLQGVETSVCPNPELQKCEAFADVDRCCECQHSWQTHMHMMYRLTQTIIRTEDPMTRRNMRTKEDQLTEARKFIAEREEERNAREQEIDKIMNYCAHFAAFLKKYSIVPYNDAYLEYLEHLIKEETNKVSAGGTDNLLQELKDFKDVYEQLSGMFRNDINKGMPLKTLGELYDMVEELKTLTYSGEVVQGVQNIQLLTVRQNKQNRHTEVRVNSLKNTVTGAVKGVVRGLTSLFGG